MDAVEQILVPLLEEHLRNALSAGDGAVPASATIADRLESLELVELVLDVEAAFGIRLLEDDLARSTFESMSTLATAVGRAQAAA